MNSEHRMGPGNGAFRLRIDSNTESDSVVGEDGFGAADACVEG